MSDKNLRRWMPVIIAVGVILPALVLAGIAALLTIRMARVIEGSSRSYNLYVSQMVLEGFKQELLFTLGQTIDRAENVARAGGDEAAIRRALESHPEGFEDPTLYSLDQLMDMTLLLVDGQPVAYTFDPVGHPGRAFAGKFLRGREGDIICAGGWWFDPGPFLRERLDDVLDMRLQENPRIYGGPETLRSLSFVVLDSTGTVLAQVREHTHLQTAHLLVMDGPFLGYRLRASAASGAAVSWIQRFVGFQLGLILLMMLVIGSASVFALIYTGKQLQLAQHKASFVSNVSHELKTPIALIRLAVDTLELRRYSSPEEQERFLRSIGREVNRLSQLVDNILDFSRLEAGRRQFRFTPVDVGGLAREVFESFRPRLEDQGFRTEVALPADLPPVLADAQAIEQCLGNLIDNAMKYSRDRKEIRIAAEPQGPWVALSVSDHGIGIPVRDQKRIFEQFVRLDEGLVHEVKGAGLGLALVDFIVRAHHGHVEVRSLPGEGSTFTLLLPLAETASQTRAAAALGTAQPQGGT
jgi:signal transduction histidine kinase